MGAFALTGSPVFQINQRPFSDFADGDCVVVDFPQDLGKVKTAKNGNVIAALDNQGFLMDLTVRLLLGGGDDRFLNSIWATFLNDPATYIPMTGYFVHRVGDSTGAVHNVIYQASVGVPKAIPKAKLSSDGDFEQAVSVWFVHFGFANRTVQ